MSSTPPPSDRELGARHVEPWAVAQETLVYTSDQCRLRIGTEHNAASLQEFALAGCETDAARSDLEFVEDFMNAVRSSLSPHQLSLLTLALGNELIDWGKKIGSDESMELVYETIEKLESVATAAHPGANP